MIGNEKKLNQIREQIQSINEKLGDLEDQPLSRDEALADIDQFIESQNDKISFDARAFAYSGQSPNGIWLDAKPGADTDDHRETNIAPIMAWLFPTEFKQRLIDDMDKAGDWGEPHAERIETRRALDAARNTLEAEEESLICTLADDGTEILRRPDIANPIHILLKRAA